MFKNLNTGAIGIRIFSPFERTVSLRDQVITDVNDLDLPFTLDIILQNDIVDVGIDDRRTLIDRCPEWSGDALLFFARNATVRFDDMEIRPLL